MNRLTIKRPVVWKAIVTAKLKEQLTQEVNQAIRRLDMELQQLEFQAKRVLPDLERQNLKQAMDVRRQFEAEKRRRRDMRDRLRQQAEEVERLQLGEEIHRATLESYVEVGVGDDLEAMLAVEVITRDGQVTEIRQGVLQDVPSDGPRLSV